MTYAPLDDRFDDHPKYAELGAAEMGIIACAITYATRNLSDGRIPRVWPERRFGKEGNRLAARMVKLTIWTIRSDGDYEIVGYLDHNPSKADVEAKRAKRAAAGSKGGKTSAQGRVSGHPRAQANAVAIAKADTQVHVQPTPLHSTLLEALAPLEISSSEIESVTCQVTVAAQPASETRLTVVPEFEPDERYVHKDDKLPAELRAAAEMLGVHDVESAWLSFCGKRDGQWLRVSGAWQAFCTTWRNIERTQRDKRRPDGPVDQDDPYHSPELRKARDEAEARRREAEYREHVRDAVPMPAELLAKLGIKKREVG